MPTQGALPDQTHTTPSSPHPPPFAHAEQENPTSSDLDAATDREDAVDGDVPPYPDPRFPARLCTEPSYPPGRWSLGDTGSCSPRRHPAPPLRRQQVCASQRLGEIHQPT